MTEEEKAERFEQLILSEPAAARITPELIDQMLCGFRLAPVRDAAWIAKGIRPIIWVAVHHRMPKGNAEIRDNLIGFASRLRELFWDDMALRRDAGDACLELARDLERRKEEFWPERALAAYYDPDSMIFLAEFYETVAVRLHEQKQQPKWRAKAKRDARVHIAANLAVIFEEGFGRKATLDKWPSARGNKTLGAWAEFYQLVMAECLGEEAIPDLEGVLTEARKLLSTSGYSPGHFIGE